MPPARSNPDVLDGVPGMVILQLPERRPAYGYVLVEKIREETGQVLTFGEGCVDPTLHRTGTAEAVAVRRAVAAGRDGDRPRRERRRSWTTCLGLSPCGAT